MAKTIEIQIGRVATKLRTLEVPVGSTLEDAIDAAEEEFDLTPKESEEVMVNGDNADYQDNLHNGDTVMFVRGVAGGR
jgi:hypothetical protein